MIINIQKYSKMATHTTRLTIFFIMILLPTLAINSQHEPTQSTVYGVRWALGDRYAFHNVYSNSSNNNYYILSFNTDQILQDDMYAEIGNSVFTCSAREISIEYIDEGAPLPPVPNTTYEENITTNTIIYRCYINRQLPINQTKYEYQYSIYTSSPIFMHNSNPDRQEGEQNIIDREIKANKKVLFEGKFRPPPPPGQPSSFKFFAIGDWAPDDPSIYNATYHPILPAMMQKLQADHSLNLFIFLGDIAYDFLGDRYFLMLRYMQQITSRICFMATPGNHDYVYHQDAFELFAETFLSPQWDSYYDFYYTFVLGNILFIEYTPESLLYKQKIEINISPLAYLKETLTKHSKHIADNYHVVVFSHYAVYCSNTDDSINSCHKDADLLAHYLQIFKDLGMDFYLSGHLHDYERTHAVCWAPQNKTKMLKPLTTTSENGDAYSEECPVYVVEGGGGNMWMDTVKPNPLNQYSAVFELGTSFGIGSIISNGTGQKIYFEHHLTLGDAQTKIMDKFTKELPSIEEEQTGDPNFTGVGKTEVMVVVVLLTLIVGLCFCGKYGLKRQRQKPRGSGEHVEMVEQNFQTIVNSDRPSNEQSASSG